MHSQIRYRYVNNHVLYYILSIKLCRQLLKRINVLDINIRLNNLDKFDKFDEFITSSKIYQLQQLITKLINTF